MPYQHLLTDEEFAFLQEVLEGADSAERRDASFVISGTERGLGFLQDLAQHAQLTLTARVNNVQIRFAMRIEQDALHTFHMRLQTPSIVETGSVPRAWRATLEPPIQLYDLHGLQKDWWLTQLSSTGAVIRFGCGLMPKQLRFSLRLSEDSTIVVIAQKVRVLGESLAAYRIFISNPHQRNRLNAFLYHQHQRNL